MSLAIERLAPAPAGSRLHGPATRGVRLSAVLLQLSRHRGEVLHDTVELVA